MRNLLIILLTVLLAASCKKAPEYLIQGTINGATSEMAYLIKVVDGERVTIDSVALANGAFVFTGNESVPQAYYIKIGDQRYQVEFFVENSSITINADLESLNQATVSGSATHDEYRVYLDKMNEFNQKLQEAYDDYVAAREEDNAELAKEIEETRYKPLREERLEWQKEFVKENSSSYVSPFVIYRQLAFLLTLDEFEGFVNSLSEDISDSPYVITMKENIATLKRVDIGQPFVDITLPDTTGVEVSLSEFVGNGYVLIDFWAAWCGPCRRENPHIVKIYDEFKDKGFEIFGVSFDRNREDWIQAIHQDGITWPQVSDLKFWNSAAGKLYGVRSIPHTVLIGPDGTIIDKNLRHEQLREKLVEVLGN
jgi:peroxiredoxin